MKLLKTIKKIIKEAEEHYNQADVTNMSIEEIDKLEKNYRDSLRLLTLYEKKLKKSSN